MRKKSRSIKRTYVEKYSKRGISDYMIYRDDRGRFLKWVKVSYKTKEYKIEPKAQLKRFARTEKKLRKIKIKQVDLDKSKKYLRAVRPLLLVNEKEYNQPLKRVMGKLVLNITFFKRSKGRYLKKRVEAESSAATISKRNYKRLFNECYRKCLAQITFSPDGEYINGVWFRYWFRKKDPRVPIKRALKGWRKR